MSAGLRFWCDIPLRAFQRLLSSALEQSPSSIGAIYLYTSADTLGRIAHLGLRDRIEDPNIWVRRMAAKSKLEATFRVTSPGVADKGLEDPSSQPYSTM